MAGSVIARAEHRRALPATGERPLPGRPKKASQPAFLLSSCPGGIEADGQKEGRAQPGAASWA